MPVPESDSPDRLKLVPSADMPRHLQAQSGMGMPEQILRGAWRYGGLAASGLNTGLSSMVPGLSTIMPTPMQPQGTGEQLAEGFGRQLGYSIPAVVGMGVAAHGIPGVMSGIGAAPAGASALRLIFADSVDAFSKMSLPQLARIEAAIAAASATGGQVAKELFPNNAMAEMFGELIGMFGIGGVGGLVSKAKNAIRGRFAVTPETARLRAGRLLSAHESAVEGAATLRQETGLPLPLGTASGDPNLIGIQQELADQAPGVARMFDAQTIQSNRILKRDLEKSLSITQPENATATARALENRIKFVGSRMDVEIQKADAELAQVMRSSRGMLTDEQRNIMLRRKAEDLSNKLRDGSKLMYQAVDPENKVHLSAKPVVDEAQNILDEVYLGEHPRNIPPVLRQIKAKFVESGTSADSLGDHVAASDLRGLLDAQGRPIATTKPKEISFNELTALRSRVGGDIRDLLGSANPNRAQAIRRLGDLESTIDDILDSIEVDPVINAMNPGVVQRYRAAKTNYKLMKDKIERGAVGEILHPGMYGNEYKLVASEVANNFVQSGKGAREAAQDFRRAFGGDVEAQQILHEHAINELADKATVFDQVTGKEVFSLPKARQWVKLHSDALEQFPALKRQITTMFGVKQKVERLIGGRERALVVADKSAASLWLGEDADRAMERVLQSTQPNAKFLQVYRMVNRTPDPKLRAEAMRGLRRSFFEAAMKKSSGAGEVTASPLMNPDKLESFFAEYPKIVGMLWNPKELAAVKTIAEPIRAMMTPGISDTADKLVLGVKDNTLHQTLGLGLSRAWGVARGLSPTYAVADIGLRSTYNWAERISSKEVRQILNEAFYNPEVAQQLINLSRASRNAAAQKLIVRRMLRLVGATGDIEASRENMAVSH